MASREQKKLEKVEEVKKNLAAIRGLSFTEEVPILFGKREVMQRYLEADLLEDYGEEKLKDLSLAYAKLGLFPLGFDLRESLLRLYNDQVIGLYVPKAKKVLVLEESAKGISPGSTSRLEGDSEEMVLLHELTHALQDQNFSLGSGLGPSHNDDKSLAFRSIAEGDAILTEFAYRFGGMDQWSMINFEQALQSKPEVPPPIFSDLPAAIADKLQFQYEAGASFVYRVLREKGWQGINVLYKFPPQSTEQVLHPEKYFDLPDPPTQADLRDLSVLFPPGWLPVENNTLGELMVECLFKQFVPRQEAKRVANGWGGDRFVAFRRDNEASFIWVTVWDSPEDADEFFQKYQEVLSRKYTSAEPSGFYTERREHVVVVVEGLEKAHIKENIEMIWQGMKLEKEAFHPPFVLDRSSPSIRPSQQKNSSDPASLQ